MQCIITRQGIMLDQGVIIIRMIIIITLSSSCNALPKTCTVVQSTHSRTCHKLASMQGHAIFAMLCLHVCPSVHLPYSSS